MSIVWITWQVHRRTREIARALDIPLIELTSSGGWLKYPRLIAQTTWVLFTSRPTVVFVQCPSIVLAVWAALLRPVFGFSLVVDLHNEAVQPFVNRAAWYASMVEFVHRAADLGIVTNEGLIPVVEAHGGRAAILPDRVPDLGPGLPMSRAADDLVVFVCSFAPDEPYVEVIEAARALEGVARIAITGRATNIDINTLPANVSLTGFLPNDDYERLLASAAVVVDLTSMEDCLVCGAYEAVALGKPLVTSDTAALRRVFDRGAVFTRHSPAMIASAISKALARAAELSAEMRIQRQALHDDWNARRDLFADRLAELCDIAAPVEAPSAATHN